MKQTELEVGKEYWLDQKETIKVKFTSYTYRSVFGDQKKEEYKFRQINSDYPNEWRSDSVPGGIHEVSPKKPFQFTTPIAMKCTEEQFNGIKDKLVEMGYETSLLDNEMLYLCTNYNGAKNSIEFSCNTLNQPLVFETFNPDLFLALAAMTDAEDGINGEWWTNIKTDTSDFTLNNLYKQASTSVLFTGSFISNSGAANGYSKDNPNWFRKATEQEIIEHFENKDFVLPRKWCVKVNDSNLSILGKWVKSHKDYDDDFSPIRGYVVSDATDDCSYQSWGYDFISPVGYTEITFDKFKKYVLKEEFLLQPRWYVELTHENYDIVKKWHERIDKHEWRHYVTGSYYGVYENGDGDCWASKLDAEKYQIITTDEFKKYVLKETPQSCPKATGSDKNWNIVYKDPLLFGCVPFKGIQGFWLMDYSDKQDAYSITIHIPPTKQATLFDDRVEITDWKPKAGEWIYEVDFVNFGWSITKKEYRETSNSYRQYGMIKRTESEAKQLVEKLKKAML